MSAVPAAVDALVDLAATVIAPQQVFDGSPLGEWPDQDIIIVGWAREGAGVTIESNLAGLAHPDQEAFTVACLISCVGGDVEIQALRFRAFNLHKTFVARIRQDQTLNRAVTVARPATAAASAFRTGTGGSVELTFTIACTAFA